MHFNISLGTLLLSIFLILFGLGYFLPIPGILTAIAALAAGILLIIGK